eukprot:6262544-Pyramimonas_sp.AAC.1
MAGGLGRRNDLRARRIETREPSNHLRIQIPVAPGQPGQLMHPGVVDQRAEGHLVPVEPDPRLQVHGVQGQRPDVGQTHKGHADAALDQAGLQRVPPEVQVLASQDGDPAAGLGLLDRGLVTCKKPPSGQGTLLGFPKSVTAKFVFLHEQYGVGRTLNIIQHLSARPPRRNIHSGKIERFTSPPP